MGALPVFRRFRMPATFYVPSGLVCQPGISSGCQRSPCLTLAGVRQIAAAGQEIGGLSVRHVPLSGMPAGEAQREICDDPVNLGTVATSRYSLAPVHFTSTRLIAFGALVAAVLIAAVAARRLRSRPAGS
jgi:hypothetical protein